MLTYPHYSYFEDDIEDEDGEGDDVFFEFGDIEIEEEYEDEEDEYFFCNDCMSPFTPSIEEIATLKILGIYPNCPSCISDSIQMECWV